MKSILMIRTIVSILSIFTIIGCGGSGTSGDTLLNTAVQQPCTETVFDCTTEFTTAMISGQSIYEWNDANDDGIATKDEWLRATFESNGNLLFERNGTTETVGSYTVVDGKIIATTIDGDKTIILNAARATEWDVTFVEDKESTTWFLELKYSSDMLVGKRFSIELSQTVVVEFTETTAKIYDMDGILLREEAYAIENGILITNAEGVRDRNYLIKLYSDGSHLSWYAEDPEANLYTYEGNAL
ncbi:hypothetical protein [Sulfurovum sp. AR]|uniref:hypothetical protein n=1 Tax=Sulfurovum sp. AR TaxID=1165841 RepID=UPI00025C47EE|nr:hypothetical protein [Sulfurovum sp. AR]EIF50433.1 hypothetical protein SULAR_08122 [Sulfurovum sp. AR]